MHPSTSYLLLIVVLIFFSTPSFSQVKEIKGQVVIFNSKVENGKIIFVKNAKISSPISGSVHSDKKGRFKLKLKQAYDGQPIFFQVKKNDYHVVDHKSLQYSLIDKKPRLRIALAKKGYIKHLRHVITSNAKKALYAKENEFLDLFVVGGATGDQAIEELEKNLGRKINSIFEAEEIIDKLVENIEENAHYTSYELAIVNPDFATEFWTSAMDSYNRSDLDVTIEKLQEENVDELSENIISKIEKVKDRPKKVDWIILSNLRDLEVIKNNYTFQIIALQQSLRMTEADIVLKKLIEINSAAPTHKHSQIIEKLDFFQIVNPIQENENIVLQQEKEMATMEQVATKKTPPVQNTIDSRTRSARSVDDVAMELANEKTENINKKTESIRRKNKAINDETIVLENQSEVVVKEEVIPVKEIIRPSPRKKEVPPTEYKSVPEKITNNISFPSKVIQNNQGNNTPINNSNNNQGNVRTKIVITISTSNEIIDNNVSTSTPTPSVETVPQSYEIVENNSSPSLNQTQDDLVIKGEEVQQKSTETELNSPTETYLNSSDFENILFHKKVTKKNFKTFLDQKEPVTTEEKLQ